MTKSPIALCHGVPGLRARSVRAPYWRKTATVRVRIDTEEGFEALGCWYGEKGCEHSAGTVAFVQQIFGPGGQKPCLLKYIFAV